VTKDDNVATFLLNRAILGSGYDCTKKKENRVGRYDSWSSEKLRAYIAAVKSRFHPSISQDASLLLERHYSACRSSETICLQITVRFLESLIRLTQAHARLMYKNTAELDDAVAVVLLMEASVASCTSEDFRNEYFLSQDPTTTVFPDDDRADYEFLFDKAKVLGKYQMQNLLSSEEIQILQENDGLPFNNQNDTDMHGNSNTTNQNVYAGNILPEDNVQDHYGRWTQCDKSINPNSPYGPSILTSDDSKLPPNNPNFVDPVGYANDSQNMVPKDNTPDHYDRFNPFSPKNQTMNHSFHS